VKLWYGWWLLAATTAVITLQSGVYVFGFGLFFVPIVAELGLSRAAGSGAVSLARLEGGLIGPIEGYLIDRWGPRRVMLVGIPLFALGFLALSQVDSLLSYYLVYVLLLSLGGSLGFFNPCSAAVANWFVRRRGFALGLMSSGIGLGTALVPALAWLIGQVGWRSAAAVVGVVVLLVGVPLATVVRHRPEPYGHQPDGAPTPTHLVARDDEPAIPARVALRTRPFWILATSFGVRVMTTSAVSLHLIPLMTDLGIEAESAALMITALGLSSIVGRLGLGWLGDRWGQKRAYAFALVMVLVGFLLLANASTLWHVALFIALYGPSYGGLAALMLSLRGDYFGRRSFATIGGLMSPVMTVGTLAGPVFAGLVFDTTGSYSIALYAFAGLMVVALALLRLLTPPRLERLDLG
jgi:MFS family permease